MKWKIAGIALLVVVASLGGWAFMRDRAERTGQVRVDAAMDRLVEQKTYALQVKGSWKGMLPEPSSLPVQLRFTAEGAVDLTNTAEPKQRTSIQLETDPILGMKLGADLELLAANNTSYFQIKDVRFPVQAAKLQKFLGKWVQANSSAIAGIPAVNVLKGLYTVTGVAGHETVDGVTATIYTAVPNKERVENLVKQYTAFMNSAASGSVAAPEADLSKLRMRLWLDDAGLLRRLAIENTDQTLFATMDFSDFGKPVVVEVPQQTITTAEFQSLIQP